MRDYPTEHRAAAPSCARAGETWRKCAYAVALPRVRSALQIHPRKAALWLDAAAYQFDELGDAKAGRVMLQRGLRMIPSDTWLW